MMSLQFNQVSPKVVPPLDPGFAPLVLANRQFREAVKASGQGVPLAIVVERGDGTRSRYDAAVFPRGTADEANLRFAERLVKTLLWARGGWKVYVGGPAEIGNALKAIYAPGGARAFDAEFMGGVYEHEFTVEPCAYEEAPAEHESTMAVGGHLEGYRIGLDLGASDRKVAAVVNGEEIYSEEVVWDPRPQTDPQYHFDEINTALKTAASHMPRVDAIGVSSAGVYINNRVRVASLFRGIPKDQFDQRIAPLFLDMKKEWNDTPLEVVNDGEVTALAGAMSLEDGAVIGVAMGSSEAGGYVTPKGLITNWLNELAFVPIDASPNAPIDEWSGDVGCGALYLSQQCVGRLIEPAGIEVDPKLGLPEKLKAVQKLMAAGDQRAVPIYETVGAYLGYALAYYADFYEIKHALVLGRVTSGDGGDIIIRVAQEVLAKEFPALAGMQVALPDEKSRRVGQAIAAASLPAVK
ncbi:MAG: ROK family protein [Armatimonadota bacterium]